MDEIEKQPVFRFTCLLINTIHKLNLKPEKANVSHVEAIQLTCKLF